MSKAMGVLKRSRRLGLLVGVAMLLGLGVLILQPPAILAAVLKPQVCTYYSDSSYSVVVGHATLRCNGSFASQSGTITLYRICQSDYCCGNVWC